MTETQLAYGVDRSWSNVQHNLDGDLFPSQARKYHRDRGDSTAACSTAILLNALKGDRQSFGPDRGVPVDQIPRDELCRRCFPEPKP